MRWYLFALCNSYNQLFLKGEYPEEGDILRLKSNETQHLRVTMIERWKSNWPGRECVSASFLDFSKAFDTVNHGLLLAKLKAYGFSLNALKLVHNYLNNRKQQVQMNNKFSSESTIIAGVPQGFIDGLLLYNLLSSVFNTV